MNYAIVPRQVSVESANPSHGIWTMVVHGLARGLHASWMGYPIKVDHSVVWRAI